MWLGGVARRPAADVEKEMGELARRDRANIATPIPRPPRAPGRFFVAQRPPLPPPPGPINPYTPDAPESERRVRAAAISARVHRDTEEFLKPLMDQAASAEAAPKPESPPRGVDDHYDLAKWGRRYSRWN